jgi:mono/diheme cytochrome c family protein
MRILVLGLVCLASGAVAQDELTNPRAGKAEAILDGRRLFNSLCFFCHGTAGRGAKGPNLVDEHWKYGGTDAAVFRTIAGGVPGTQMGAFGGRIAMDEIWDLIAYLRDEAKAFQLEHAGPGSLSERAAACPDSARATIVTDRLLIVEGALVQEDEHSVTVEDRSGQFPSRFRVRKADMAEAKVTCIR